MVLCVSACGKASVDTADENIYTQEGVEISKDAFEDDSVIEVETIKEESEKTDIIKKAIPEAKEFTAYEITAENAKGSKIQPDGTVKVTFPVPKNYDSKKNDVSVYYVSDDGNAVEFITSTIEGNKVLAYLQHFSTYVVALVDKEETSENTSSENISSTTSKTNETSSKAETNETSSKVNSTSSKVESKSTATTSSKAANSETNTTSSKVNSAVPTTSSAPAVTEVKKIKIHEKVNYYGLDGFFTTFENYMNDTVINPETLGFKTEDYLHAGSIGCEYMDKNTKNDLVFYYFTNSSEVIHDYFWADLNTRTRIPVEVIE